MGINEIWIYEIDNNKSGGIIIADTEEEARKKLSLEKELKVDENSIEIYPLNALDLNKSVHQLWQY